MKHLPLVSTKKEVKQAFEDLIIHQGPCTCKSLVERLKLNYRVSRVEIDNYRAAQYLRENPNIVVLGNVNKVHVYGIRGVNYSGMDLCNGMAKQPVIVN